jgi:hypothetical protein
MPSSNPLPPKENALFKRILVSLGILYVQELSAPKRQPMKVFGLDQTITMNFLTLFTLQ